MLSPEKVPTSPSSLLKVALVAGIALLVAGVVGPPIALAADTYTSAQADQGHQLFNDHCAECHRPDLTGALGPALKGSAFAQRWTGKSVEDFYQFEHANMPANSPGSMPKDEMLAITAYILKQNGVTSGSGALSEATAKSMKMPTG